MKTRPTTMLCSLALVFGGSVGLPLAPDTVVHAQDTPFRWEVPSDPAPSAISSEEYASRRAALAAELGDGVFVALGETEPAEDYLPYAQKPNFRYLTGITEPEAALIMTKSGSSVQEILFVRPSDPSREVWEGHRLGPDGATELTGIPARTIDELGSTLEDLLQQHTILYTLVELPGSAEPDEVLSSEQQVLTQVLAGHPRVGVQPVEDVVRQLRAAKSPAELDLIRRAVWITNLAHQQAQLAVQPDMNEFEVQALIEYTFRRNGAEGTAFSSIVGSGPNSTTLHYREADRFMRAGELLVMDIGASYRGYAADVTRTVPVSGRFSPEQREIYSTVLAAQKAAESAVRLGGSWAEIDAAANAGIAEGLTRMGLIDAPDAEFDCAPGQKCPQFSLYYMHSLGHGIGLDVHDPDVSVRGTFREGSAFTIEPGIYVRSDVLDHLPDTPENRAMAERLADAVERYQDNGVRIEDSYLLTSAGLERVSEGAPREIDEVEAMLAQPRVSDRDRHGDIVDWYPHTDIGR